MNVISLSLPPGSGSSFTMPYSKHDDPYRYVKARDLFSDLDSGRLKCDRVENVKLHPDQFDANGNIAYAACSHGRAFLDEDKGKIFLIQFVRPTVFRIRFNPEHKSLDEYSDRNS